MTYLPVFHCNCMCATHNFDFHAYYIFCFHSTVLEFWPKYTENRLLYCFENFIGHSSTWVHFKMNTLDFSLRSNIENERLAQFSSCFEVFLWNTWVNTLNDSCFGAQRADTRDFSVTQVTIASKTFIWTSTCIVILIVIYLGCIAHILMHV